MLNLPVSASPLLFGTARPLPSTLQWPAAIFSISDKQSERHMDSSVCRSDGNFHTDLENPCEYPHKPCIARIWRPCGTFSLLTVYGSTFSALLFDRKVWDNFNYTHAAVTVVTRKLWTTEKFKVQILLARETRLDYFADQLLRLQLTRIYITYMRCGIINPAPEMWKET